MSQLRKLPALLGLLLALTLVGGTAVQADASTSGERARARAAVLKARHDVAVTKKAVVTAKRAESSAVAARTRATDALAAARARRKDAEAAQAAAAADVQGKQAQYDQAHQNYLAASNAQSNAYDSWQLAETYLAGAERALQAEKDNWYACTRSTGSFTCRKTQSSDWVAVPKLDRLYEDREWGQRNRDRAYNELAAATKACDDASFVDTYWAGQLDQARAALDSATAAVAAAQDSEVDAAGAKASADHRVAVARTHLRSKRADYAKAQDRLRRANARLRQLS